MKNKEDYNGGTNEKALESDDSSSNTDGCARNLGDIHEDEEDGGYIETPPEDNDTTISKCSGSIT